jgi:predicted RNA-binding Zn-ribbon protein involved in translation (DUF1610 family)
MGFCKKIIMWLKNLNKQKCPKCESVELEKINKEFIKSYNYTHTYYRENNNYRRYDLSPKLPIERHFEGELVEREVTVDVYKIIYKCNNCGYISEKEIHIER